MATALVSMISKKRTAKGLAMTGELTLTGRVLPIGGVKEKVIAAKRVGLNTLILPKANQNDVEELPDYLREGLTFFFVRDFGEVGKLAFRR